MLLPLLLLLLLLVPTGVEVVLLAVAEAAGEERYVVERYDVTNTVDVVRARVLAGMDSRGLEPARVGRTVVAPVSVLLLTESVSVTLPYTSGLDAAACEVVGKIVMGAVAVSELLA